VEADDGEVAATRFNVGGDMETAVVRFESSLVSMDEDSRDDSGGRDITEGEVETWLGEVDGTALAAVVSLGRSLDLNAVSSENGFVFAASGRPLGLEEVVVVGEVEEFCTVAPETVTVAW